MKIACAVAVALLTLLSASVAFGGTEEEMALWRAFKGAQLIDLRTNQVSSVVALREKVKIVAPSTPVLVKTFEKKALPQVLQPVFSRPGVAGGTINGRYIALLQTDLHDELDDVLRHELVHAYITLASPKPLPLWFQEGSAVHFSMGKDRKFYGQPSKDQVGVMVGRTVELPEDYKQKLQTFNYIMQTVGEKEFNKWYKQAIETGDVDPRPLLGLDSNKDAAPRKPRSRLPMWGFALAGAVVLALFVVAYISSKRGDDDD